MNVSDLVTDMRIFKSKNPGGTVLANGQLTLCGKFKAKFSIFNGKNGPFVNWPSERDSSGQYVKKTGTEFHIKTCGPVDKESEEEFAKVILAEYENPTYNTNSNNTISF